MIVNHITQLDTDGRVSSSHVIAMTDNSDLARVRILRGGGGGGGGNFNFKRHNFTIIAPACFSF